MKKVAGAAFIAMLLCAGTLFGAGQTDLQQLAGKTREVAHAMGRTSVPARPVRVVVLTNEGTEALLALGVTPVGAVRSWLGSPWYEHISDRMEGVTVVGTESGVNLETVLKLQPDLILGNKMRQEKIYNKLSAIAPTVFSETLRGAWQDNFMLYAKTLGLEEKGAELIRQYDNRVARLREDLGDKLGSTVSIVRFMQGRRVRMYYKDSFSGVILEDIGLARPKSQNRNEFAEQVTRERIPEMDADYLFYFTYDTGSGEGVKLEKEWLQDPLWKNLQVVKHNRAFRVYDGTWNTSGGIISANTVVKELRHYLLNDAGTE